MEDAHQDTYANEMLVLLQTENGEQIALPISALPSEAVSGEEGQVIMVEESASDQQEIILESEQEISQVQLAPLTQLPSGLESETMTIISSEPIQVEHLQETQHVEIHHEEKQRQEIHHIDQLGTSSNNMLSNSTKTYSRKTISLTNHTMATAPSNNTSKSIEIESHAPLTCELSGVTPEVTENEAQPSLVDTASTEVIESHASTCESVEVAQETTPEEVPDTSVSIDIADSNAITITEPVAIDITEPVTIDAMDPVSMNITDPVATDTTEPVAITTADSIAIDVTEPVVLETADPVTMNITDPVAMNIKDPVAQAMVASQVCTVESLDPPTKRPRRRKAEISTRPLYDEEGSIEFQEVPPFVEQPERKRPKKERRSNIKTNKPKKIYMKVERQDTEDDEQPLMTTTPDPSKSYSCKECGFSTDRINNLVIHMKETCSFAKKRWQSEVEKLKSSLNHPKN